MSTLKQLIRRRLEVKTVQQLINKIKNYKYVSFDIFDTLLKRDLPDPHYVFDVIGKKIGNEKFKAERLKAEHRARQLSVKEEVSLSEIYDQITPDFHNCMELEIEIEKDVNVQNRWIGSALDYCTKHNITVIAISDMYLPEDVISQMLSNAGISVSKIFVSSSYGVQKASGNLYRIMLKKMGISAKNIIHIGDTYQSDYKAAHKVGINAVLIPRRIIVNAKNNFT